MWDWDRWQEIGHSLRSYPLRTTLTACGVAWGIFLLVVLLGVGKGLEQGLTGLFKNSADNSVWLEGQTTSATYDGLPPGRSIRFSAEDVERLASVPGIVAITPEVTLGRQPSIRYGNVVRTFGVNGVGPSYTDIGRLVIRQGRFLNPLDISNVRRVAVLGARVSEVLFGRDVNPVGESIEISGVPFRVIGRSVHTGHEPQQRTIYIPVTTYHEVLDSNPRIPAIGFMTASGYGWDNLQAPVLRYLAREHLFDPSDVGAVAVWDGNAQYRQVQLLLLGVRTFIIVVGLGTLAAGCIGVSNIMLAAVRERTREIGIRKAIGATPMAIVLMILQEAFVITTASGAAGLGAGLSLIYFIREQHIETEYFRNPHVDLPISLGALGVLIVAGLVAGYLPARQAVQIKTIEALRHE